MKKILLVGLAVGLLLSGAAGMASAALLTPVSVTPGGEAIINDYLPPEGTRWTTTTTYWNGTGPQFTIDYGARVKIEDVVLSVDNNDYYQVDYSPNGQTWSALFTIASWNGNVNWGMDTMSSVHGDGQYVAGIDFAPVTAQYLKVYATGGDNMYSVGELQSFGTPTPEPATLLLLGSGLAGLVGARRRKKA